MRLSKTDKKSIVRAIMDDVPMTDYPRVLQKEVQEAAYQAMPPSVKAVYDNPDTRHYLEKNRTDYIPNIGYVYYVGLIDMGNLKVKYMDMSIAAKKQDDARAELANKLTAVLAPITTLKQAKVLLPEFEKYFPAERARVKTDNLPTALVFSDLTKLGWPKSKEKESSSS